VQKIIKSKKDISSLESGDQFIVDTGADLSPPVNDEVFDEGALADHIELHRLIIEKFEKEKLQDKKDK